MSTFDPTQYGPVFEKLLQGDRLRSLDEGTPDQSVLDALESLTVESAFAHTRVLDHDMARCCLSGVWLRHDFLDHSHTISQGIATPSGSFWHGIMHRREADFSNAKYWFRKVGPHPLFEQLTQTIKPMAAEHLFRGGIWDPFTFVDACQAAISSADTDLCRRLQQQEWELLFDDCYTAATAAQ